VLLLQSHIETFKEVVETLSCLPLAGRGLRLGQSRRRLLALGIFAVALLLAAMGVIPAQISFVAAVVLMVVAKIVSPREAYESVGWPIIILLGAMIPIGEALETTGGAQLIANLLLQLVPPDAACPHAGYYPGQYDVPFGRGQQCSGSGTDGSDWNQCGARAGRFGGSVSDGDHD
jgi:hypothetical protein